MREILLADFYFPCRVEEKVISKSKEREGRDVGGKQDVEGIQFGMFVTCSLLPAEYSLLFPYLSTQMYTHMDKKIGICKFPSKYNFSDIPLEL